MKQTLLKINGRQYSNFFIFLFLVFFLQIYYCYAGTVDTINIYSNAMHKSFKCVIIKPDSYKKKKTTFPVVYLLHGWAGDYSNWIKKKPELKNKVDELQIIIVCPDGGWNSWYFDSPVDSTMKFETYIATEVPEYIDSHYRTIKKRTARAITGLSMGGHGAFFLSFRHANIFGACGSTSGGMDLYESRNKFDIMKRLGDTIIHLDNWKKYSVINVIDNLPSDSLGIIFDCGMDDAFFPGNKIVHEKLLKQGIKHDYIERPGNHSWSYWVSALDYQLMFFRKYFDAMRVIGNKQ
jgi:S-formylglutathione hydrolase FrmB